jgi:TonB family protein
VVRILGKLAVSLAASGIAGTGPALAQPPAPAWVVDWGEHFCTLVRRADAAVPFEIGLNQLPGGTGAHMVLLPHGSATLPSDITDIALLPSSRSFPVRPRFQERPSGRVLILYGLPTEFRDALANAVTLELRSADAARLRVPLGRPTAAVAAHRRCVVEVAREWGIDEAALGALQRGPVSTNNYGFHANDYPALALRDSNQGRVVARIDVNAEGRAAGCTIVGSSGSRPIDTRTCEVVLRRARFTAPLDAHGRPTSVRFVALITWLIES